MASSQQAERKGVVIPVRDSSIPAVFEHRAQQQPNERAFTFVDYEVDPAGYAESLTWSQVGRRARVAQELFDYVVAFLGALQFSCLDVTA